MFRAAPTDVKSGRGKYCSKTCAAVGRKKLPDTFVCKQCGMSVPNLYGKIRMFCSRSCATRHTMLNNHPLKGKKTPDAVRAKQSEARKRLFAAGYSFVNGQKGKPAWNRGLGVGRTLNRSIRGCAKMETWQKVVTLVYNNKCARCFSQDQLHVHHLHPLRSIVLEENVRTLEDADKCARLWDLENGILLCKQCHREIHQEYHEVDRTMFQLVKDGVCVGLTINGVSHFKYVA